MRSIAVTLLLALGGLAASSASPASASTHSMASASSSGPPGVARWPSALVTYRDRSGRPRMTRAAVKLWNRATTRVRLVPARRGRRAQITITSRRCPHLPTACAEYPPGGRVFLGPRGDSADDPGTEDVAFRVMVHEIGHALGLGHAGRCSIMHPNTEFVLCRRGPARTYRCGPQRLDARALVRLYGGRVRSGVGHCRHPRPPRPRATLVSPTGPVVLDYEGDRTYTVRLRNEGSAAWRNDDWRRPRAHLEGVGTDGRPTAVCGIAMTSQLESPVAAGDVATFSLTACPPEGYGTQTVRLRLVLERYGAVRRGPTFTLDVTVREPPQEPEEPVEEPYDPYSS